MPRAIPAACLPHIHEFERGPGGKFAATTYMDAGAPTIGWGHRIVNRANPLLHSAIDRKKADDLAIADLIIAGQDVESALGDKLSGELTEGQFAGLCVFLFNIGAKQFGSSTIRAKLIDRKFDEAAAEFDKWIFTRTSAGQKIASDGLRRRRAAEKALFTSGGKA